MRGKVPRSSVILDCVRITPAYAGKSGIVHAECENLWDHPRLCGEKFKKNYRNLQNQGSPPPMRGKEEGHLYYVNTFRITPAYAGKR